MAGAQDLFLPIRKADQTNYGLWTEEVQVDLDTLKTVKSGKDCFFPQSETLYSCKNEDGKLSIDPAKLTDEPFVVFGMRACDVQGLKVLDNVFLNDPVDSFYAARREHGTVVAIACHEPEETCFCKVFGIDAANPAADVATWFAGEELYWKALTEKGEALTDSVKTLFTDGDDGAVEEEKKQIRAIIEKLPCSHLDLYHDGPRQYAYQSDAAVPPAFYAQACVLSGQ